MREGFLPGLRTDGMVGSRTVTDVVGLAAGLLLSVLAWIYWDTLALFVFLPFLPFLFRRSDADADRAPPVRRCPTCDFRTRDPEFEYCPRDGSRLETRGDERDRTR